MENFYIKGNYSQKISIQNRFGDKQVTRINAASQPSQLPTKKYLITGRFGHFFNDVTYPGPLLGRTSCNFQVLINQTGIAIVII